MPFALVLIGLILVVTGARGTMREFGAELRADFTGPGNFIWWIVSIGVVGFLGYIPEFRSFSRWFMTLIVIAMVLSNRGFFAKLMQALEAGPEAPETASSIETDALWNNLPDTVKQGLTDGVGKGVGSATGDLTQRLFNNAINNDNTTTVNPSGSGFSSGVGSAIGDLFRRFSFQ